MIICFYKGFVNENHIKSQIRTRIALTRTICGTAAGTPLSDVRRQDRNLAIPRARQTP